MDYVRIKKQIIKSWAKIRYYGIGYAFDLLLFKMHLSNTYSSMKKKEGIDYSSDRNKLISEMGKWFTANTGERLDLDNPITFNQKIQWLKLFDLNPLKTILVDKYRVRSWVSEKIGEEYLVPLLGVWKSFDDIDFSTLPKRYALKCNHGSHWNIIVDETNPLDRERAKVLIDKWMGQNFAYMKGFELQYKDVKPLIIAEQYLENTGGELFDYKFFCFSGKVQYIQFLSDRASGLKAAYFNREWVKQDFTNNHPMVDFEVTKPNNLNEMIALAEKLAEGFAFVRVDFYRLNDGSIKFGEMTFSPASGTQDWRPASTNRMLGDLLALPKKN